MKKSTVVLIIIWMVAIFIRCATQSEALSRKRRHLIFPKGSNFIVMLTQTRTLPFAKTPPWFTRLLPIWQGLIEFELKFPLPPEVLKDKHHKLSTPSPPWQAHFHPKPGPHGKWWGKRPHSNTWRRRWSNKKPRLWNGDRQRNDRRRVQRAVADLLDANGLDGEACLRRAQCNAALSTSRSSNGDFEEPSLLEHFLRLIFTLPQTDVYDEFADCAILKEECPFSLLDVLEYEVS